MVEHEVELGLSIGVASARYRRRWEAREHEYVRDVAQDAGLTDEQMARRLEDDPEWLDLVALGARRAGDVPDYPYRRTLAALAAATFTDDALVDEMTLLHSQIIRLEPAHLRVLAALRDAVDGLGDEQEWVNDYAGLRGTGLLSEGAVRGALEALRGIGMVEVSTVRMNPDSGRPIVVGDQASTVSDWGRRALEFLHTA